MPEPLFDPRVVELLARDRRRWTHRWLHRPASLASRALVALICLLKRLLPFQFAAHGAMDRLCVWFLRRCVSPEAVELLVRHFIVETNLLNVLADNAPGDPNAARPAGRSRRPHPPATAEDLRRARATRPVCGPARVTSQAPY